MKTFIIAEAGVNHNGDVLKAKKLVDVAAKAGANAVKFQCFHSENLVTTSAPKAGYQMRNMRSKAPQRTMLKRLELSFSAHKELLDYCKNRKIIFLSTPFDKESVDELDKMGMAMFKIASGEITHKDLLEHIASKGKPIICSTGMSTLAEVHKAVHWIKNVWRKKKVNPSLTLLHCVSDYPARVEDANLLAMKTMAIALRLPVGYSDHTPGIEIAIAAAALGACVIEKHFTLDRRLPGPDHKASLEPNELRNLVRSIRNVEKALGLPEKRPSTAEIRNRIVARRSLVAAKAITKGQIITGKDIVIKRPGNGIPPEERAILEGKTARHQISVDSVFKWTDVRWKKTRY